MVRIDGAHLVSVCSSVPNAVQQIICTELKSWLKALSLTDHRSESNPYSSPKRHLPNGAVGTKYD